MECASRSRQPEASPDIEEIDFNPESPHEDNLILKVRMKAIYFLKVRMKAILFLKVRMKAIYFLKVRMKAIFIIGAYAQSLSQRCLQDMF